MKNLPAKAIEYIRERFHEATIVDVKKSGEVSGHFQYQVDVNENDIIYHLRFNDKGGLLTRGTEPRYEEDYEEGKFYGAPDEPEN